MKIALIIIGLALLFILMISIYVGIFNKPVVSKKSMGPFYIVYKDHIGPYQETGTIQDEIYHYLKEHNIETTKGIGIYFDNPQKVPKDQLRSQAGCIIEQEDIPKINNLNLNYKSLIIEKQKMIYTEFPFNSKLSIFVGILKVYPLMQKYCEVNELSFRESIEIYDVPNKKIIYLMKIE